MASNNMNNIPGGAATVNNAFFHVTNTVYPPQNEHGMLGPIAHPLQRIGLFPHFNTTKGPIGGSPAHPIYGKPVSPSGIFGL